MSVTKKNISSIFGVPLSAVKQVGAKQLFIIYIPDGGYRLILVSYKTIIGYHDSDGWYITTKKYSHTTSRQITAFSRGRLGKIKRIDNDTLVSMLPVSLQYFAK